ncbi:MAG: competence/damage-inducible protein A [Acidobacteriota bacterium]
MRAEIITIGSELLSFYFTETNSMYLTRKLEENGIIVGFKTTVGDNEDDIINSIKIATSRVPILITTGGLGPTEDDITKSAFSKALAKKLIFSEEILHKIKERFKKKGIEMPEINVRQAFFLEGAEILDNEVGIAPGMWIEDESNKIAILPGPPSELIPMMEKYVIPKLRKLAPYHISRKTLKIAGLSESETDSMISDIYRNIKNPRVTLLAYPGQIEIHILGRSKKSQSEAEETVEGLALKFKERLGDNVFSTSEKSLEEHLGELLRERNETLAIAESCTGGLLSSRITDVPGSSDYFERGIICYSNQSKVEMIDVEKKLLEIHGAVSREVSIAMAESIRKKSKTTYGIGITGIAGPAGSTKEKPVGLVHVALSFEGGYKHSKNQFFGTRSQIKFQATQKALDMLRRHIIEKSNYKT